MLAPCKCPNAALGTFILSCRTGWGMLSGWRGRLRAASISVSAWLRNTSTARLSTDGFTRHGTDLRQVRHMNYKQNIKAVLWIRIRRICTVCFWASWIRIIS